MQRAPFTMLCATVLCAVLVGVPVAGQAGTGLVLTPAVREGKIESNQHPFPESSAKWGRAVALVDAPADEVMAVLQDYGAYKDFLPGFEASRVLSKRGAAALLYVQVSVMKGALKFWAELKLKPKQVGATRVIEAKMTKGNVDRFQAIWEVTPFDERRSLVAFQLMVEPHLPLPASVISDENQKNTRGIMRALRKRIDARKPAP